MFVFLFQFMSVATLCSRLLSKERSQLKLSQRRRCHNSIDFALCFSVDFWLSSKEKQQQQPTKTREKSFGNFSLEKKSKQQQNQKRIKELIYFNLSDTKKWKSIVLSTKKTKQRNYQYFYAILS